MNTNQQTLNVRYNRFENFKKFYIAKIRRQTSIKNSSKKNSYDLMILNENSLFSDDENVNKKTAFVTLMMNTHKKKLSLILFEWSIMILF